MTIRPDQPLADIAKLEAAAEVQRRLISKLESIKRRDDEAFRELNQAVASARTSLARRHCDEAGFGWRTDERGDQVARKLPWLPEATLSGLASLWAAHGISSGDRGPRGTFAQFVQDWLAEPEFDDREALLSLLKLLVQDHYLSRDSDGAYQFRFPLIKRWWKINRSL